MIKTIVTTIEVHTPTSYNWQPQTIPIKTLQRRYNISIGSLTEFLNLNIASAPIVPSVITKLDWRHKIIVAIKKGNTEIVILNDLL